MPKQICIPSEPRRKFLKRSSLAAASCFVVSPDVLGGPGAVAPSDQFRFAQIGVGGKGATDLKQTIKAGGRAVALCDVDVQRAGKTFEAYKDLPRFTDYREMLEEINDEIDAVVVSTPDHVHGVQGLDALRRQKHVYLQKPLARTFDECERLRVSAVNAGVATQMGNQGHSGHGLRVYQDAIERGILGPIKEVHCWTNRPIWPQGMTATPAVAQPPISVDWDLWLGPVADRPFGKGYLPFAWRGWWDFGCGAMGDMACHNMDPAFTALQLGMPTEITATAEMATGIAYPNWSIVEFKFPATPVCPEGVKVTWYDGDKMPDVPSVPANKEGEDPGYTPGSNGCLIVGEAMSLAGGSHAAIPEVVAVSGDDASKLSAARLKHRERIIELRKATTESQNWGHYKRWIEAARSGDHGILGSDFNYAASMTQAILLGCIATRFPEQTLNWNADEKKFVGFDQAREFLQLTPRDGYDLSVA